MNSLNEISEALAVLAARPSRCDGEQGVADYELPDGSDAVFVYRSWCSVPESTFYARVTGDCHCGCGDPALSHPCIGHDVATGVPLEGPSRGRRFAL